MKLETAKNNFTKLIVFGYYQIVGGVIGIGITIWFLLGLVSFNWLLLIIVVPAFFLFLFSVYCGFLLLRKNSRGIKLSLLNQYLQLISFAFTGYAYQYASGVFLTIGIDLTESFNFLFNMGISSWELNINTDSPTIALKFNLVAFYLIIAIEKIKKQIAEEEKKRIIAEIGDQ